VHGEHGQPIGTLYIDHVAAGAEHGLSSTVYNESYRPNDMDNYAGIRFEIDGEQWFISESHGEGRGEIDGAEAEAFAHVARTTMRLASLPFRLNRSRVRGLLEGLAASRTAAIVLDQDGRVSAVTSAAEVLFDDSSGVSDPRLLGLDPHDAAALEHVSDLARSRLAFAPRHSLLVRGRCHARPVLVNVFRIDGSGLDALPGTRLLLVLTYMGARDRVMAADPCRLFVLTPAEADVVVQFIEGSSILRIAARRRVVEATIREQMESVYPKTDVTRQANLVGPLKRLQR
jgi:DNA-binding CsgD family transcriptional regulator